MDPFYEIYKNAGLIPIEICISGVIALICYAGIFLNLSLVYVTVKSKSLHRPCNILIALYAFFISFVMLRYSIKFFVVLFGINYITLRTCYIIQFVPQFCTAFGFTLQLCIGIDRLIGVLFPFWYKLDGKYKLFKYFISINLLITLIITCVQYYGASSQWDKPVMCDYADNSLEPQIAYFNILRAHIIYSSEVLCYVLIWAIILCRKTSQISSKNKRLMISLSIIMAMGIVNVLLNMLFAVILPRLNLDIYTIKYVTTPVIYTIHIVVSNSSITPVLLLCSKQYSCAFRECFKQTTTAVTTVAPIQFIR